MTLCSSIRCLGVAALLAALALPASAWAAHGKVGLWQITVTMQAPGRPMPNLSAADRAQMEALGVKLPNGHTVTMQHCMTKAEVNSDALHAMQEPEAGCELANKATRGHTYSANMVCTGEMKGKGHVMVSYDTSEHYTGKMTFSGTSNGRPANIVNLFDGKWVSADCGNVRH